MKMPSHIAYKKNNGSKVKDTNRWTTNLFIPLLTWTNKKKKAELNLKMQIAKEEMFYRLLKWLMTPFLIEAVIPLPKAIEALKVGMKEITIILMPNPN